MDTERFRRTIWEYYRENARQMPWRETDDPYRIFISEVMLQQTQVSRVLKAYERFIAAFPDFPALAHAPLRDVLTLWQGMGYNRRAVSLHKAAGIIVNEHDGVLPRDTEELQSLPGIGPATAGSLAAFAYNAPTVFIETNIRRVFIHFFFPGRENVHDRDIMPLVEETLDRENPREWYYALMDNGTMLKAREKNPNRRSAHYQKQSRFEGSDRQIRGAVLRILTASSAEGGSLEEIREGLASLENLKANDDRLARILDSLVRDGLLTGNGNSAYRIR